MGDKEKFDQTAYINQYKKAHYKRTNLELSPEENDALLRHIARTGETKASFIRRAIFKTIESDRKERGF